MRLLFSLFIVGALSGCSVSYKACVEQLDENMKLIAPDYIGYVSSDQNLSLMDRQARTSVMVESRKLIIATMTSKNVNYHDGKFFTVESDGSEKEYAQ